MVQVIRTFQVRDESGLTGLINLKKLTLGRPSSGDQQFLIDERARHGASEPRDPTRRSFPRKQRPWIHRPPAHELETSYFDECQTTHVFWLLPDWCFAEQIVDLDHDRRLDGMSHSQVINEINQPWSAKGSGLVPTFNKAKLQTPLLPPEHRLEAHPASLHRTGRDLEWNRNHVKAMGLVDSAAGFSCQPATENPNHQQTNTFPSQQTTANVTMSKNSKHLRRHRMTPR